MNLLIKIFVFLIKGLVHAEIEELRVLLDRVGCFELFYIFEFLVFVE